METETTELLLRWIADGLKEQPTENLQKLGTFLQDIMEKNTRWFLLDLCLEDLNTELKLRQERQEADIRSFVSKIAEGTKNIEKCKSSIQFSIRQ